MRPHGHRCGGAEGASGREAAGGKPLTEAEKARAGRTAPAAGFLAGQLPGKRAPGGAGALPPPGGAPQALRAGERLARKARLRRQLPGVSLARAPGRINLIGEHTDYNGLPVFPFAIHRDLAAAFAAAGGRPGGPAQPGPGLPPPRVPPGARHPALRHRRLGQLPEGRGPGPPGPLPGAGAGTPAAWRGLDAVIHGDIPPAAGLSSSSALVVLGALMLLAANGLEPPGPGAGHAAGPGRALRGHPGRAAWTRRPPCCPGPARR